MHAALLSLVLMSVSCGDPQSREVVEAPAAGSFVPQQREFIETPPVECIKPMTPPCSISVSYPAPSPVYGCPGCGCGGGNGGRGCGCGGANSALPPAYRTCPENAPPQACTQPAWETDYHPAWYFCHRMFLHPADYVQPYPYRERFPYAGLDPRCQCAVPPIGY
jgi:hypothetical protein